MLVLTEPGRKIFTKASTDVLRRAHLFTDAGELKGYGYQPRDLDKAKWNGGVYPDLLWEFEPGDETTVVGYFVTSANGTVLYTEQFDLDTDNEPMIIGGRGDKVRVAMALRFFTKQEVRA